MTSIHGWSSQTEYVGACPDLLSYRPSKSVTAQLLALKGQGLVSTGIPGVD